MPRVPGVVRDSGQGVCEPWEAGTAGLPPAQAFGSWSPACLGPLSPHTIRAMLPCPHPLLPGHRADPLPGQNQEVPQRVFRVWELLLHERTHCCQNHRQLPGLPSPHSLPQPKPNHLQGERGPERRKNPGFWVAHARITSPWPGGPWCSSSTPSALRGLSRNPPKPLPLRRRPHLTKPHNESPYS